MELSEHRDRPEDGRGWAEWLSGGREGHDAELRRQVERQLEPIRRRILDDAGVTAGQTVLDVGCGDGFLGVGVLERVGLAGEVVFADIEQELVEAAKARVEAIGPRRAAVRYLTADVTDLTPVDAASVDAVVVRSVLSYVRDRAAALRAIARVLRPGGRLALFEPLNGFFAGETGDVFAGWDTSAAPGAADAVRRVYELEMGEIGRCMRSLTVEMLVAAAEAAGFVSVGATVEATSTACLPGDDLAVRGLLHGRGNPFVPTVSDAAKLALGEAHGSFLRALEEAVRSGAGRQRAAGVHLRAVGRD